MTVCVTVWNCTEKGAEHFKFTVVLKWTFIEIRLVISKCATFLCLSCWKVRKFFDMVAFFYFRIFAKNEIPVLECRREWRGNNIMHRCQCVSSTCFYGNMKIFYKSCKQVASSVLWRWLYPYFCDQNMLLHVFNMHISFLQPLFCSCWIPALAVNHWTWIFWVISPVSPFLPYTGQKKSGLV